MNDEVLMRELVTRFHRKGWLRKLKMRQEENNTQLVIEWTDAGRAKIMTLYGLLDELMFMKGGRRGGEILILFEMITDKKRSDLPNDHQMRPFLQTSVNMRFAQAGWIKTERKDDQVLLTGWTEAGLAKKRQFQEILSTMDCSETFVEEFQGIHALMRACASSSPPSESEPLQSKRF